MHGHEEWGGQAGALSRKTYCSRRGIEKLLDLLEVNVKVIVDIYLDGRIECVWYAAHISLRVIYRYGLPGDTISMIKSRAPLQRFTSSLSLPHT